MSFDMREAYCRSVCLKASKLGHRFSIDGAEGWGRSPQGQTVRVNFGGITSKRERLWCLCKKWEAVFG